jgi:RimJ/RimL family protein N-acetyltransferase
MTHRLEYYILIVPAVFICSIALSFVLNMIYTYTETGCTALYHIIAQKFSRPPIPVKTFEPAILETERLLLRPFREEDADDMYEYASDPDVGPMAGWKPHESRENSLNIIRSFIKSGDVWALELKETHRVIGSIGLHHTNREIYNYDFEIGYVLAKSCWGRGLMPEAARCMINFAFRLGAETLLVSHFDGNWQSQRVIEKLGFKPAVHIEKSFRRFDGAVLGENIYLLSAAEYFKSTKESEEKLSEKI